MACFSVRKYLSTGSEAGFKGNTPRKVECGPFFTSRTRLFPRSSSREGFL